MSDDPHYFIPQEKRASKGIIFALLVHVALVAFLWIGVSWQSDHTSQVEAEVWDLKYEAAAPRATATLPTVAEVKAPPVPAPAPKVEEPRLPDPDIALAQEKKDKARKEKARKEKLLKEKALKEKKRKAEAAARAKKQRLAREKAADAAAAAQAQAWANADMQSHSEYTGSGGTGTAANSGGATDAAYDGKIMGIVKSNMIFIVPPRLDGNPIVEYKIELLPDGSLRNEPRKIKASGLAGFDEAVRRAILKSAPFPKNKNGRVPSLINLIYKPKDL